MKATRFAKEEMCMGSFIRRELQGSKQNVGDQPTRGASFHPGCGQQHRYENCSGRGNEAHFNALFLIWPSP
jgi:hypothetical protein